MKRTEYKNQFIKYKYDRITLVVPKGHKGKIKKICSQLDISVNEYINMLISNNLQDFKTNNIQEAISVDLKLLEKWQVPKKYYPMIEEANYSKERGYFIKLKKGFTNDITKSRIILVTNTKDMRMTINKSRKV